MARTCYVSRLEVSDNIGRRRHRASPKDYVAAGAMLTVPAFGACFSSHRLKLRHARASSKALRAAANTASRCAIQGGERCMLIWIRTSVCLFSAFSCSRCKPQRMQVYLDLSSTSSASRRPHLTIENPHSLRCSESSA